MEAMNLRDVSREFQRNVAMRCFGELLRSPLVRLAAILPFALAMTDLALSAEKYRALTGDDRLSCEFYQSVSVSEGPGLSGTMSATANHFECGNHNIVPVEIKVESVEPDENGKVAIRTRKFGTVYRWNGAYEMTDSQIKNLRTFVEGGGRGEDSADSTFGWGEWMIAGLVVAAVAAGILVFVRRPQPDSGDLSIK